VSQSVSVSEKVEHSYTHPIAFLVLVLPFGVVGGYITVAYAYLFSQAGISTDVIAALIAASLFPHVIKFLWAPLVDTTLTLKKWYILSSIVTSAGILVTGILPIKESSIPLLTIIVVITNVAVSFLDIAVNGLAAYDTPEDKKGKAGGYLQAGNLGGAGVGGGVGLWLTQHLANTWMAAAILAVSCFLCCFALFFVKEAISTVRAVKMKETFQNLFKDIWVTIKAKLGFLALFLCFLPIGTGAASNLWSAIAGDWQASANTVAFATGIMSGIITAVGCLLGGWICDKIDRQKAYIIFGVTEILCSIGMAYSPHTQLMYIVWTTLYSFSLGLCYAGFTAFVLEAIGKGAAATKYTVYASISNAPITYMTIVDGWAHTKYGPTGMLNIESLFGVIGIILFFVVQKLVRAKKIVAEKG